MVVGRVGWWGKYVSGVDGQRRRGRPPPAPPRTAVFSCAATLLFFFLAQFVGISVAPPDSFYFVPILQMASGVTSTRKCQAFCSRFANATSAARSEDASTTMALAFAHLSFIIIIILFIFYRNFCTLPRHSRA